MRGVGLAESREPRNMESQEETVSEQVGGKGEDWQDLEMR